MKVCSIQGCARKHYAKGACGAHYTQSRLNKNPGLKKRYREDARNRNLISLYGISTKDYSDLLSKQGGECAICKGPPVGRRRVFCVDHCHKTGKVRGLLCIECNFALGKFKDSPQLLKKAAEYVEDN